jgi:alpha-galactosidase
VENLTTNVGQTFTDVGEVVCDPGTALIYEHGWQSWSPTTTYSLHDRPYRPAGENIRVVNYRADGTAPEGSFQGEGLLAVQERTAGPVHVFAVHPGADAIPSIRARVQGHTVVVYFMQVTEQDMLENLDAIDELRLPVDVVQLDDGYQAEIGDWLTLSGRFRSLRDLVARIRDRGRRVGIWTAPFLVGQRSRLDTEHPEWLIQQASAGHNWHQDLFALDITHSGAAAYLHQVFSTFHQLGIDFFKIDFIYAGALGGRRYEDVPSVEAYRRGVRLIRDAIGPRPTYWAAARPFCPASAWSTRCGSAQTPHRRVWQIDSTPNRSR